MISFFFYFCVQFSVLSTNGVLNVDTNNLSTNNNMHTYDRKQKLVLARTLVNKYGFSMTERNEILRLHNLYRGNVTPPAGNMALMEWSECLTRTAQAWVNNCNFKHNPSNSITKCHGSKGVGENLYWGHEGTGVQAMTMWYEEYVDYAFKSKTCRPKKMCGHYTQIVWSSNKYVGCGLKTCNSNRYLIGCHYIPGGNYENQHPYVVGKPCSLCNPIDGGGFCINGLCVTTQQCIQNPSFCTSSTCPLKCRNCGISEKKTCTCRCALGWDYPDCSVRCENKHASCLKNPGWPTNASCKMNNNRVQNLYCRKMCDQCRGIEKSEGPTEKNPICCNGKLCPEGYVFDSKCNCRLLCPGPICFLNKGGYDEEIMPEIMPGNACNHYCKRTVFLCIILKYILMY